ncbi:hypothetical protein psal_cds_1055 [Pandoravirus salinus]|uniref:Uncharacterized protein n=1 Tax=Pandoravirus salinus TaxID=1349410 RepID=S4VY12_9VIRU|nr:hypothetical protein psal_cds_1055 [Pandoravirus salinus]AGO85258.1 hypothetical protein psal_cds_1055 [Pandoravirus salinus]
MHATDDAKGHRTLGLLDLPPELRAEITRHVQRPADVVACARTSPALLTKPVDKEIIDRLVRPIRPVKLFKHGAPPSVLADLASRDLINIAWSMLPDVVASGRADSLTWVCQWLMQTPRPACQKGSTCYRVSYKQEAEAANGWYPAPCSRCRPICNAVKSAAAMRRYDMLCCLLDERAVAGRDSERLFGAMIRNAAYRGDVALVASWHERNNISASGGHCCCDPSIGQAALRACRIGVLDWLCDHNCNAVVLPSLASIECVLVEGAGRDAERASVIGWLIDRLPPSEIRTGGLQHATRRPIKNGMAACLARLCDPKLVVLGPAEITYAFVKDARSVLYWISRNQTTAWAAPSTGYAVAHHARKDTPRWFLRLPGAGAILSVGAVKSGLAAGRVGMAIAAHETGVLAFDRYDAAAVACEHLDDQQAARILSSGASCTTAALTWALKRALIETLRVASEHVDAEAFQAALDAVRPGYVHDGILPWISVHFSDNCIAQHCLAMPFRYKPKSAERAAAYETCCTVIVPRAVARAR